MARRNLQRPGSARRRIIDDQPNVVVALAGRAENVALVREVLAGLADEVDFGYALDDIKAAVSEACNNVVIHAYDGDSGPLEVEVRLRPPELEVVVRDRGVGIGGAAAPPAGIGLAVIEALTTRSELRQNADRGLEVAMHFDIPRADEPADLAVDVAPSADGKRLGADGDIEVAIAMTPPSLGTAVLNRLVGALAARAGFSIDRLSDAQLVTDAIAARIASVLDDGYLNVAIEVLERTVALRVGHLRNGGSASLLAGEAIGEPGPLIERLTDAIEVSQAGTREMLRLVMRDARSAASGAA
jgi:serine/threonine-protein kinase RsbW